MVPSRWFLLVLFVQQRLPLESEPGQTPCILLILADVASLVACIRSESEGNPQLMGNGRVDFDCQAHRDVSLSCFSRAYHFRLLSRKVSPKWLRMDSRRHFTTMQNSRMMRKADISSSTLCEESSLRIRKLRRSKSDSE
mmetsp:Transcript_11298/g.22803  ORF Transcript_11298/g.22803 Transcript_11298/m.22803 type:complete len:139 (-) Transcript_11298:646-1062(-)